MQTGVWKKIAPPLYYYNKTCTENKNSGTYTCSEFCYL